MILFFDASGEPAEHLSEEAAIQAFRDNPNGRLDVSIGSSCITLRHRTGCRVWKDVVFPDNYDMIVDLHMTCPGPVAERRMLTPNME